MKKIPSFQVNHLKLFPGIYIAHRYQLTNDSLTTFDLRFRRPNFEAVMSTAGIHTIEHIGATFLRNDAKWKDKIIYFGPMGCRTGFYLIIWGEYYPLDIIELMKSMLEYIIDFQGVIPGAEISECGNYVDMNLAEAIEYSKSYLNVLNNITDDNIKYESN